MIDLKLDLNLFGITGRIVLSGSTVAPMSSQTFRARIQRLATNTFYTGIRLSKPASKRLKVYTQPSISEAPQRIAAMSTQTTAQLLWDSRGPMLVALYSVYVVSAFVTGSRNNQVMSSLELCGDVDAMLCTAT